MCIDNTYCHFTTSIVFCIVPFGLLPVFFSFSFITGAFSKCSKSPIFSLLLLGSYYESKSLAFLGKTNNNKKTKPCKK